MFDVQGSREDIRKRLFLAFVNEAPGTGREENASKYQYYVEELADGKRVFLKRPGRLNKGVDFMVCVEGYTFGSNRNKHMASFNDLIDDLVEKMQENANEFDKAKHLIQLMYACKKVEPSAFNDIQFTSGYPIELVLKLLKWFFIEQDVTYWNYSGRRMLYDGLRDAGLV
mgnify:FL=1